MVVRKAVVATQHGKQHRQREISVVHAALLAALAVNGVHWLTGLDGRHHFFLPGNDPEKHTGAHGGGQHGTHQQKGGTPRKPVAGQPRRHAHQAKHQRAHHGVAVFALTQHAANQVVQQPEHHQKRQRHRNGLGRRPVHARLVNEVSAGTPQVRHREQCKAGQPGAVALPVKPVQVAGQLGRRHIELDRVVKPATMHRPELATDTLLFQVVIHRRGEAAVQKHKIKGGANPGDGGDDVDPAQQQVGPVEVIAFHKSDPCSAPREAPHSCELFTTAGTVNRKRVANTGMLTTPRSAATTSKLYTV